MSDYVLQHHGILGQKWGQRRFQNEDGSLTPAGRKRYGVDNSAGDYTSTTYRRVSPKELSDEELKKGVARLQSEKTYNKLVAETNETAWTKAGKFLGDIAVDSTKTALTKAVTAVEVNMLGRFLGKYGIDIQSGKTIERALNNAMGNQNTRQNDSGSSSGSQNTRQNDSGSSSGSQNTRQNDSGSSNNSQNNRQNDSGSSNNSQNNRQNDSGSSNNSQNNRQNNSGSSSESQNNSGRARGFRSQRWGERERYTTTADDVVGSGSSRRTTSSRYSTDDAEDADYREVRRDEEERRRRTATLPGRTGTYSLVVRR